MIISVVRSVYAYVMAYILNTPWAWGTEDECVLEHIFCGWCAVVSFC